MNQHRHHLPHRVILAIVILAVLGSAPAALADHCPGAGDCLDGWAGQLTAPVTATDGWAGQIPAPVIANDGWSAQITPPSQTASPASPTPASGRIATAALIALLVASATALTVLVTRTVHHGRARVAH